VNLNTRSYRNHVELGDAVLLHSEGQWNAVLLDQHVDRVTLVLGFQKGEAPPPPSFDVFEWRVLPAASIGSRWLREWQSSIAAGHGWMMWRRRSRPTLLEGGLWGSGDTSSMTWTI